MKKPLSKNLKAFFLTFPIFFVISCGSEESVDKDASLPFQFPKNEYVQTEPFDPAYTFDFELTGDEGNNFFETPELETDSILKLQIFYAGGKIYDPSVNNTPYEARCAKFDVEVRGHNIETDTLNHAPGIPFSDPSCQNARNVDVIDFSHRLGGSNPVTVLIKNPLTSAIHEKLLISPFCYAVSFNQCPGYTGPLLQPMHSGSKGRIQLRLQIQTNGTEFKNP